MGVSNSNMFNLIANQVLHPCSHMPQASIRYERIEITSSPSRNKLVAESEIESLIEFFNSELMKLFSSQGLFPQ